MAFLTLELQTMCHIKDVGLPRVGSDPPPSKGELAKNLFCKSERVTLSYRVM